MLPVDGERHAREDGASPSPLSPARRSIAATDQGAAVPLRHSGARAASVPSHESHHHTDHDERSESASTGTLRQSHAQPAQLSTSSAEGGSARASGVRGGKATRYFGLSVMEIMSLPENRDQSLPRIVVYLCEWLLARASKVVEASAPGADHAVEIDMQEMIEQPIDTDLFTEARRQFNVGNFRDHNSKVCMFRLLKAFIRELSAPLVPRTLYDMAIAFARTHMRETVAKVQASSAYPLLIEGFSEKAEDHALLTAWLARHWEDGNERLPPEHLAEECFKLVTITESIAFSVGHPMAELAELFFKLPKANRAVLEYLAVCFVKLDLMNRRGTGMVDDVGQHQRVVPPILAMLAETLASHILKPPSWSVRSEGHRSHRKRMQEVFLLCFFYFVKRKHNLISAEERSVMNSVADGGEDAAIEDLLFEEASTAVKLSHAFQNAISIPYSGVKSPASTPAGSYSKSFASESAQQGSQRSVAGSLSFNGSAVDATRYGSRTSSVCSARSAGTISRVLAPPVTRTIVDAVVEVSLDASLLSESGDGGRGSPRPFVVVSKDTALGDPAPAFPHPPRHQLVNMTSAADMPTLPSHAAIESISRASIDDDGDEDDDRPLCSGAILCDFIPRDQGGFAGAATAPLTDNDVALHAPCLTRWLDEAFLPYDGESQPMYFATDPLPSGSVFRIGSVGLGSAGAGIEYSVPPGELLLPILGTDFAPGKESDVRCHLMFSQSDLDDVRPPPGPDQSDETAASAAEDDERRGSSVSRHRSRASRTQSSTTTLHAINYDYALAFPRTLADSDVRRPNKSIVERFLAFSLQSRKEEYEGDIEFGFLNHTLPNRRSTMHTMCEACEQPFGGLFSRVRRSYCRYCSKELCTKCCNRKFIIPSYILQFGDFNVHAICQPCENHLQKHLYTACLELDRLSPAGAAVIGQERLGQLARTRENAMQHIYYSILPRCPARHTVLSLIPQSCVPYLSVFPMSQGALVSLADLCELQTRHIYNAMKNFELFLKAHVEGCPHCTREVKQCGAGHLCHAGVPTSQMANVGRKLWDSFRSVGLVGSGDGPPSFDLQPRVGVSLAQYEDLLTHGHTPAEPIQEVRLDDDIVLCRSCTKYCHRCCFEMAEEQCSRCVALRPDAARTPKAVSPLSMNGLMLSSDLSDVYLWDVCQEVWY